MQIKQTLKIIACSQLTTQNLKKDGYILRGILEEETKYSHSDIEKKIQAGMIIQCLKNLDFEIAKEVKIAMKLDSNTYTPEKYEKYLGIFSWKKYQHGNIDYKLTEQENNIYESSINLKVYSLWHYFKFEQEILGKTTTKSEILTADTNKEEETEEIYEEVDEFQAPKEAHYIERPEFKFEAAWLLYIIFGLSLFIFVTLAVYYTVVKFTSKQEEEDYDEDDESISLDEQEKEEIKEDIKKKQEALKAQYEKKND